MEFGWLQQGAVRLIVGAVTLALAIILLAVYRCRRARAGRSKNAWSQVEILKEELRFRLAEPIALFGDHTGAAPTMGAGEAFEGDIETAARTVLQEAGGHRAKA